MLKGLKSSLVVVTLCRTRNTSYTLKMAAVLKYASQDLQPTEVKDPVQRSGSIDRMPVGIASMESLTVVKAVSWRWASISLVGMRPL